MQLNQSDLSTIVSKSDALQTYARRLARLMYLKQVCETGHHVLSVELELIEIARGKLQEYVKSNVPHNMIWTLSPQIIAHIKAHAIQRIKSIYNDDIELMQLMIESLDSEDLSSIAPVLN